MTLGRPVTGFAYYTDIYCMEDWREKLWRRAERALLLWSWLVEEEEEEELDSSACSSGIIFGLLL